MRKPTVGSLFSGMGGMDLALERAGFDIVWQCDNNVYCKKVLKKHWPDVELYSDIKDCYGSAKGEGERELVAVDVICGGFP
jgi:DNA (cytosine-5)-methyltransferase 1